MQCNAPKMHLQKYYAKLVNSGVTPDMTLTIQFSLARFFLP